MAIRLKRGVLVVYSRVVTEEVSRRVLDQSVPVAIGPARRCEFVTGLFHVVAESRRWFVPNRSHGNQPRWRPARSGG